MKFDKLSIIILILAIAFILFFSMIINNYKENLLAVNNEIEAEHNSSKSLETCHEKNFKPCSGCPGMYDNGVSPFDWGPIYSTGPNPVFYDYRPKPKVENKFVF